MTAMSTTHKLRPYQSDLSAAIDAEWSRGASNVLAVAPTGSGKTVLFAHKISEAGGAAVAIAHRKELVTQMSLALAREGVRHRIIGPDATRKQCVALHLAELGRDYHQANSPVAAAGVDTLANHDQNDPWLKQVRLWIQDECFPAGTSIDGTPIEKIAVGDTVRAFNEVTGEIELRKVVRVFKNPRPTDMVRVEAGHHVLECTKGHPFFTRRGWVPAALLSNSDEVLHVPMPRLLRPSSARIDFGRAAVQGQEIGQVFLQPAVRVRRPHQEPEAEVRGSRSGLFLVRKIDDLLRVGAVVLEKYRSRLLQRFMLIGVSVEKVFRNSVNHECEIRIGSNEVEEPNGATGDTSESVRVVESYVALSTDTRGERKAPHCPRNYSLRNVWRRWVCPAGGDTNGIPKRERCLSSLLQTRLGELPSAPCNRGGRGESFCLREESGRCEEGRVSHWVGVDSVAIFQSNDTAEAGVRVGDGHVYNFEVEGLHTYIANGVVVHNCHHVLLENKWGRASKMFPNARGLGVTATPLRADGKGLGRHADGLFDSMVVGPSMRDLIDAKYLTDYRVLAPKSNIDLSRVNVTASGEYSPVPLKAARRASQITGDVVKHYLRCAAGKLGVTFDTDVESATDTAAAYRAAGIPAEVVSANTPDALRTAILRKFRNREVLQLVNVDLFGEGFDLPAIEVVSMARPTQSYALFVQQFGRALRLLDGKEWAIILDHVGNVERHGLPDARREWTLDRRESRRSSAPKDVEPVRTCLNESCFSVYERYLTACPHCGHVPEPSARNAPMFVDGDLVELDPETLRLMRGEIARIDGPPVIPRDANHIVAQAVKNNHVQRQRSQADLRNALALWAGWQNARGLPDRQAYKRFYLRFGIDVPTALALSSNATDALAERVWNDLAAHGVVDATATASA